MIVRILGEGQYHVPDNEVDALNALDDAVEKAVTMADEPTFRNALAALLGHVRAQGTPLPAEELVPSDAVLPAEDASVEQVKELLTDEGMIPG
ncbi:PspA-associated protein PspAA [Motilibacter aurantiacus]|uniref:PspA-associated protein PspAA n=1 Tax=Motilibacter aurantiacus TaxID=2714955 RepID=UPI00140BFC9F|nr:hypothetical protein [Motilibacter aurantiacus]NHC44910.1 hypothetical protein [Motilibacter aurantiacus]